MGRNLDLGIGTSHSFGAFCLVIDDDVSVDVRCMYYGCELLISVS